MSPGNETISSLKDPVLLAARRALGQAGTDAPTAFLADGAKLVRQAVEAGADVRWLFARPEAAGDAREAVAMARERGIACHTVSKGVFFRLLGLGYETAAAVLAVVSRPAFVSFDTIQSDTVCLLVGESIQDPRNIGVMVRTADAFGLSGTVFGRESADPWCRAAVRSTTGSIFRVSLALVDDVPAHLESLKTGGLRIIGSSAHAGTPCWGADLTAPCALVLGNETEGLSDRAAAACDEVLSIPMLGGASSLNVTVAAGILAYERLRQLRAR